MFLGVYRYYTLLKSLIKTDLVLNLFFMLSVNHFTHADGSDQLDGSYIYIFHGAFFIMIITSMYLGNKYIDEKNEEGTFYIAILRGFIEALKLVCCILILNGYNTFIQRSKKNLDVLGNIRFSILVQEFISLSLFIPILSLGKFY